MSYYASYNLIVWMINFDQHLTFLAHVVYQEIAFSYYVFRNMLFKGVIFVPKLKKLYMTCWIGRMVCFVGL